jgi:hypothetical protein
MFARRFIERYSKDRGKASWQDDEYMIKRIASFQTAEGPPLGDKPLERVTEDDLEAFVKHLTAEGRASSTRNHYVQLIRAMSRWAVRRGYRSVPMIGPDSDVVRPQERSTATPTPGTRRGGQAAAVRGTTPSRADHRCSRDLRSSRGVAQPAVGRRLPYTRRDRASFRKHEGPQESNTSSVKSAAAGLGNEAQQSRGCALPFVSLRIWQRDRAASGQCQTGLADRSPPSAWTKAGLDMEEEGRTERQRQHEAQP